MLIVLPFCHRDLPQAEGLARWIAELGGVEKHDCLLVHEKHVPAESVAAPLASAFRTVSELLVFNVPQADWSSGNGDASACNEMWIQTATHVQSSLKVRWLWMEPDCCPLRRTWADEIEADDRAGGKPFSAARVTASTGPRLSGIAVYPPSVASYSVAALMAERVPWDLAGAADFAKHGHFTGRIHHVLRTSANAPTFPDAAALDAIPPGAALFHPCKDGSLIERLRTIECPPAVIYEAAANQKPPAIRRWKSKKHAKKSTTKTRSPEAQAKINERMAKARAARKQPVTA